MVTFVLNPEWYAARAEAKWDPKDITCITANKDIAFDEPPAAKESSFSPFGVGGGLDASKSKRMFTDFSHKLVTTIQNAATETFRAITAKNTWNNIDYDSTMQQTARNVPAGVEECRKMF